MTARPVVLTVGGCTVFCAPGTAVIICSECQRLANARASWLTASLCFSFLISAKFRDVQQHALVRRDLPGAFLPDAFVEISDRGAQRASDLEQRASRDPIDPALIFVSLLLRNI